MKSFLNGSLKEVFLGSGRGNKSYQSIYEGARGRRYAFSGINRGRGTTHAALTLASVIAQSGLTVLFREMSGRNDISELLSRDPVSREYDAGLYRSGNIRYVCGECKLADSELPEAECVIYDLGVAGTGAKGVLPFCDRLFVTVGSAPWCYDEYDLAGERFGRLIPPSRISVMVCPSPAGVRFGRTEGGLRMFGFPFIPDPLNPGFENAISVSKWI